MPSFTQDAIKKSFLKLLNEKPYNKITVKDIVDDCEINRNSFYYHFDSLPALLEEILLQETDEIVQNHTTANSVYECLMAAIDFALKNKKAVLHIYNSVNREMFDTYLSKVSEHAVSDFIDTVCKDSNINSNDKEIIVMHYKCLLMGIVTDWLGNGMKYDLSEKVYRLCHLFDGSMEKAFQRSAEENKNE